MRLRDLAKVIRSANAGTSWLTLDIMFGDERVYKAVCASGVLNPDLLARLYRVSPQQVAVYQYAPACAVKVTLPRPNMSGGPDETDFDGKQQHAPLLDIELPVVIEGGQRNSCD